MEEQAQAFCTDQCQFIFFILLHLLISSTSEGSVVNFVCLEEPAITHAIVSIHFIPELTAL